MLFPDEIVVWIRGTSPHDLPSIVHDGDYPNKSSIRHPE
jgi:hypothetical protein